MRASVHIADVGARSVVDLLRSTPRPDDVPGLRSAEVALAAPLRTGPIPSAQPSRLALIAFWDDDDAIDRFEAEHRAASLLRDGWSVRLEPLRAWGSWPGLPPETPTTRSVDHEGPAVVVTLARTRMSQLVRFLRTSGPAEKAAAEAPGLSWGTALARPPFFATVSVWESSKALSTYAYGRRQPEHPHAIDVDRAKPFHHQSAFIRFRPYAATGGLGGRNPLPTEVLH